MSMDDHSRLVGQILDLDETRLRYVAVMFLSRVSAEEADAVIELGVRKADELTAWLGDVPKPEATVTPIEELECTGCIGRGTGTRCCVCGRQIPPHLWRSRGISTDEWLPGCLDCVAGRAHTHDSSSDGGDAL